MPGSSFKANTSSVKAGQVLVGGKFISASNYNEISKYYKSELIKNGWSFIEEKNNTDWGRDFGGKTSYYRKDKCKLDLQFAGESANYGWTYSIDLKWELH